MRIRFVSVPVSDQDRAKAFYEGTLGCTVTADHPSKTRGRFIDLDLPGGGAGITLVTWFPAMPPGSLQGLVIEVDDVRTTHREWSARGVRFTSEPNDTQWGCFASFEDPDGNGFMLMGPATSS